MIDNTGIHDEPDRSTPPDSLDGLFAATPEASDAPRLDLLEQKLRAQLFGEPDEAVRVGRFTLEHELGSGGMGTVWRAHDPQLDRPVALKFLRSERGDSRLFREAQALARLSHPNVISVYDVGRHEGRVWVAMELVAGRTLRQWQREDEPSARAVITRWLAAGRGLAAVHAVGLVHRDIKPDNVLLGDDGRVRLIDFGLVRADGPPSTGASTDEVASEPASTSISGGWAPLTVGKFLGTPGYAAPEMHRDTAVDARADQFGLCVSIWEALCGKRPPSELPRRRGELLPVPSGVSLSRRYRRALSRGLSKDPELRFESVDALLDALEPARGRLALVAVLGAAALGVGLGQWTAPSPDDVDPCVDAARGIEDRWTELRSERLLRDDPQTHAVVEDWAERWRDAATQTCEAVHVERVLPESSLGVRGACLSERLDELEVLLAAQESDASVQTRTASNARWLGLLDEPALCTSPALLNADPLEVPPQQREAVSKLRQQLLAVRWGTQRRELGARRERAAALHDAAAALESSPLLAYAASVRGQLALEVGDEVEARGWFGEQLDYGIRHDPIAAVDAWGSLMEVALDLDLDLARADWILARLDRSLARISVATPRHAYREVLAARILAARGELEAAERVLTDAVARYEAFGVGQAWAQAGALRLLANVVDLRGRPQDAVALHERARALESRNQDHPSIRRADAVLTEAQARQGAGELDAAETGMKEALALYAQEYGPGSRQVALGHLSLASLYDQRGELDAASRHAERSDFVLLRSVGPEHSDRLGSLSAVGTAAFRQGRFAAAASAYERGLVIAQRHLGPGSQELAWSRINLAEALIELDRTREAEPLLRQAIDVLEPLYGVDSPDLAIPTKALGAVALRGHDTPTALEQLERALAMFAAAPGSAVEQAETRWLLARALRDAEREAEARAMAEAAAASHRAMDGDWSQRLVEIQRFLDAAP